MNNFNNQAGKGSLVEDKFNIYSEDGKLLTESPVNKSDLEAVKSKLISEGHKVGSVKQLLFS